MPVERSDSPKTSLLKMQLAATQAPEEQRKPRAVAGIPASRASTDPASMVAQCCGQRLSSNPSPARGLFGSGHRGSGPSQQLDPDDVAAANGDLPPTRPRAGTLGASYGGFEKLQRLLGDEVPAAAMLDPARLAAAPILGEGLKQLVDEHEGPADTHITAPTSMRKHTVYEVLAEELHSKLEDPQLGRKKGALLFLEFAEYPLEKAFKMTSFEGSKKPPGDRMDGCTSLEDGTVWICGVPVTGAGRLGLRKQFMIVAVLLFLFIAIATYVDLDEDLQLTQADSRAAFTLRAIEVHARAPPPPPLPPLRCAARRAAAAAARLSSPDTRRADGLSPRLPHLHLDLLAAADDDRRVCHRGVGVDRLPHRVPILHWRSADAAGGAAPHRDVHDLHARDAVEGGGVHRAAAHDHLDHDVVRDVRRRVVDGAHV